MLCLQRHRNGLTDELLIIVYINLIHFRVISDDINHFYTHKYWVIREGTGIYAKIECYKTECRSISVTAHSVNISTDQLKSINICCFEHFLLCFLDILHVNMVWRILCVLYSLTIVILLAYPSKKIKIKKYYNHNSLKPHALNEGYSFGTSNHVKTSVHILHVWYLHGGKLTVLDSKFQIEGDILFFTWWGCPDQHL